MRININSSGSLQACTSGSAAGPSIVKNSSTYLVCRLLSLSELSKQYQAWLWLCPFGSNPVFECLNGMLGAQRAPARQPSVIAGMPSLLSFDFANSEPLCHISIRLSAPILKLVWLARHEDRGAAIVPQEHVMSSSESSSMDITQHKMCMLTTDRHCETIRAIAVA